MRRAHFFGDVFMSRAMAMAVTLALMSSAAVAADLTHQLVGPRFNPGLKTVPFVSGSSSVDVGGACSQQLAAHIDSGTIAVGPEGMVAHVTGMASLGSDAQLVIVAHSPDGEKAEADFLACGPFALAATPAPVQANMNLSYDSPLRALRVHAQTNEIILYVPE